MKHEQRPVAVITGAANGIGTATARAFAQRGYDLSLLDFAGDSLTKVAGELNEGGCRAVAHVVDLQHLGAAEAAIAETIRVFERVDVLVNNAACHADGSVREMTAEDWDMTMHVNLRAPAFLAKWVAPVMERAGQGVIINVSSVEAHIPKGISPAYSASKAGILGLTWDLADLLGPKGIRVVVLSPGAIDTAMSGDYVDEQGVNLSAELKVASEDRIPLRRWGQPEEVAKAIAWLASDEASYITATEITVDGGYCRQMTPYPFLQRLKPTQF